MIQIYNNKHLTWDGTTSINHYELFADTVTDLPSDPYYFSSPDKGSYKMAQGSIAWVIDVSEIYMLDSGGTWVLESISGGGGGGGGTTNYNALINKPSINSVELNGNKTLSDLGIQPAIDSSHKISADLVSTSGTTNQFNMQADWNQATTTAGDYIKNKPTLGTAAATDATAYATAAQGTKADSAIQSAGTGLSKSGTTLNHSNSVTAKTTQGFAQIAYDAQGHITGSTAATTAQADAINSGITSTDVAQITTNKNNILSDNIISTSFTWGDGYISIGGHIFASSQSYFSQPFTLHAGEKIVVRTKNKNICIIGSTTADGVVVGDNISILRTTSNVDQEETYDYTATEDIKIVICVSASNYVAYVSNHNTGLLLGSYATAAIKRLESRVTALENQ